MPTDEDLIIKIPEETEEIIDADYIVLDDDTPIDDQQDAEVPPVPEVMSWPAVKVYHPMIGQEGQADEIPEEHKFWMAANLMLAPAGAPLREGNSNIFISGKTPEDVAEYLKKTVLEVFTQMNDRLSPIQRATMDDVPPVHQN